VYSFGTIGFVIIGPALDMTGVGIS